MKAIHRQLARGVWRAGRIYSIIVFAMVGFTSLKGRDGKWAGESLRH
jgi:hypothetical protein